jgi:hypothetical protein
MSLNYPVLKAAIMAETDEMFVAARTEGNNSLMAQFYAADTNPAFYVWKTSASTDDIFDAIDWAKLTPSDVPSVADSTQTAAAQTTRALICQAKQINLQILLQGRDRINATKLKIRQSLTDSLQNVPAGVAGAALDAGWLNVKGTMYRVVNKGERLFATGTGTAGVPGLAGWEGTLSSEDIRNALAS